jgi:hypothetical protein
MTSRAQKITGAEHSIALLSNPRKSLLCYADPEGAAGAAPATMRDSAAFQGAALRDDRRRQHASPRARRSRDIQRCAVPCSRYIAVAILHAQIRTAFLGEARQLSSDCHVTPITKRCSVSSMVTADHSGTKSVVADILNPPNDARACATR